MLSGNARFSGLDGIGIVDVIVSDVIAGSLEFNEFGTDLCACDRRVRLRKGKSRRTQHRSNNSSLNQGSHDSLLQKW